MTQMLTVFLMASPDGQGGGFFPAHYDGRYYFGILVYYDTPAG
jgi:hypothetical protein